MKFKLRTIEILKLSCCKKRQKKSSQKHFFLKLNYPKSKRNIWRISTSAYNMINCLYFFWFDTFYKQKNCFIKMDTTIHNVCFIKIRSKLISILLLCLLRIFMKQTLLKLKHDVVTVFMKRSFVQRSLKKLLLGQWSFKKNLRCPDLYIIQALI